MVPCLTCVSGCGPRPDYMHVRILSTMDHTRSCIAGVGAMVILGLAVMLESFVRSRHMSPEESPRQGFPHVANTRPSLRGAASRENGSAVLAHRSFFPGAKNCTRCPAWRFPNKMLRGSAGFPTPVLYIVSDGDCIRGSGGYKPSDDQAHTSLTRSTGTASTRLPQGEVLDSLLGAEGGLPLARSKVRDCSEPKTDGA